MMMKIERVILVLVLLIISVRGELRVGIDSVGVEEKSGRVKIKVKDIDSSGYEDIRLYGILLKELSVGIEGVIREGGDSSNNFFIKKEIEAKSLNNNKIVIGGLKGGGSYYVGVGISGIKRGGREGEVVDTVSREYYFVMSGDSGLPKIVGLGLGENKISEIYRRRIKVGDRSIGYIEFDINSSKLEICSLIVGNSVIDLLDTIERGGRNKIVTGEIGRGKLREVIGGLRDGNKEGVLIKRDVGGVSRYEYIWIGGIEDSLGYRLKYKYRGDSVRYVEGKVEIVRDGRYEDIVRSLGVILGSRGVDDPFRDSTVDTSGWGMWRLGIGMMLYVVGGHYRDGEDRGDGVYENYVQLMREIGRIWKDSLKGLGGEERLKRIYDKMCEINERGIYEPLEIRNYGVLVDYGMEESKRKGYVFENGYTRIGVKEIDRGLGKGVGIRIRISDNLEVYSGDSGKTGDMFDTLLIGGEKSSRVVIGSEDSSYVRLKKWGLWLRGRRGEKKERKYYLGIDVVREPIGVIVGRKRGEWYSVVGEGKGGGDCVGVIVGGEESIVKVYSLVEGVDGKVDTLRNYGEPKVLLHGGRRIVEVDSNYVGEGRIVEFSSVGKEGKNVEIEEIGKCKVLLKDSAVGEYVCRVEIRIGGKDRGERCLVLEEMFKAIRFFSKDGVNGIVRKVGLIGYPIEVELLDTVELKKVKEIRYYGGVVIKLPKGVKMYKIEGDKEVDLGEGCDVKMDFAGYCNMLEKNRKLYFVKRGGGKDTVKIISNKVRDEKYIYSEVVMEELILEYKKGKIVLEPISNEEVEKGSGIVYNPSCVAAGDTGYFKVEVEGFDTSGIRWRSKRGLGNLLLIDSVGEECVVVGNLIPLEGDWVEDTLVVDIAGYDGRKPEIAVSVVKKKIYKAYVCIVRDTVILPNGQKRVDSAFTKEEVEDGMEYVNNVFKQIGVEFEVKWMGDNDWRYSPHEERFYVLGSVGDLRDLIDCKKETRDGIELYFIKGHNYVGVYGDRDWKAAGFRDNGIVITRNGGFSQSASSDEIIDYYNPRILSHEVLHSMKVIEDSSKLGEIKVVSDIYQPQKMSREYGVEEMKEDYGRGYYRSYRSSYIIDRLLMEGSWYGDGTDIPRGRIYGLGYIWERYVDKKGIKNVRKRLDERLINCGGVLEMMDRIFTHEN